MPSTKTGDRDSQYLSGQGVVFLADRNALTGAPENMFPVGNVCNLVLGLETTTFEHKECQSGLRTQDLVIVQEVAATMTVTFESVDRDNLALGLFGTGSEVTGAAVADAQHVAQLGRWLRLDHNNVTDGTIVVGDDAVPTITYELGKNYEVHQEMGLIFIYSAAEQTTRGAANSIAADQTLFVDYTHGGYTNVSGFTNSTGAEKWMEFAGLNTVDGNNPMQVSVYRAEAQPLASLDLITDEIAQMEVAMSIKQDTLRALGDRFFSVRQVQTRAPNVV